MKRKLINIDSSSIPKKHRFICDNCPLHKDFNNKYNINICPHSVFQIENGLLQENHINNNNKNNNNDNEINIFPSFMSHTREGWRSYIRSEVNYPIATFNFVNYKKDESVSLFLFPKSNKGRKCKTITLLADISYLLGENVPINSRLANILHQNSHENNVETYRNGNHAVFMNKSLILLRENWSKWVLENYCHYDNGRCRCLTCNTQLELEDLNSYHSMVVENHSSRISNQTRFNIRQGTKVTTVSPYEALRYEHIHGGVLEKFFSPLIGMQLKMVHTIFGSHMFKHKQTITQTKLRLFQDTFEDIQEHITFYTPLIKSISSIIVEYSLCPPSTFLKNNSQNIIYMHIRNRSSRIARAFIQLYNRQTYFAGFSISNSNKIKRFKIADIFKQALNHRLELLKMKMKNIDIYSCCRGNILGLLPTSKLRHLAMCCGNLDNDYVMHWAFLSEVIIGYNQENCSLPYSKSRIKRKEISFFIHHILDK